MIGESNHTVITGGTQGGTVARAAGLDANAVTMSVVNLTRTASPPAVIGDNRRCSTASA